MKNTVFWALAIALFIFDSPPLAAQSFDCSKAVSKNETLICGDADLGRLDLEMATAIKQALAAKPAERQPLLSDQRRWVAERDRQCAAAGKTQGIACLTKAYSDRLKFINAGIAVDTSLCQRVASLYSAEIVSDPRKATSESNPDFAADPLDALIAAKAPVTRAPPVFERDESTASQLAAWAKIQQPPFVFPGDLVRSLTDDASTPLTIDRLPGQNFYAVSRTAGTAHCYNSAYFKLDKGRARRAGQPSGWLNEDGGGCGVDRFFGAVDGNPVAFEVDNKQFRPDLGVILRLSRWDRDHFAPACMIEFIYAPAFSLKTLNAEDKACSGNDCDGMRQAALALAKVVQANPREAQRAALAQLTPTQAAQYDAMLKAAPDLDPTETPEKADELLDSAPLAVPLLHGGKLYLAKVGHRTIGWRIFADWSVKIEQLENGQLNGHDFAIGMGSGGLLGAIVK